MPIYQPYKQALAEMRKKLGNDEMFLSLEQRLTENIDKAKSYGDNDIHRSSRAEIIAGLNQLALKTISISFNELVQNAQLSSGLGSMKEFARDTQMRPIISQHQQVFQGLRNEILQFTFYKTVHDQLHSLQRSYDRTTQIVRRTPPHDSDDIQLDDDGWNQIAFLEGDVNTVCENLQASLQLLPGRIKALLPSSKITWFDKLQQTRDDLSNACDNKAIDSYKRAVDKITRVLTKYPSMFNRSLCDTAYVLVQSLSELTQTMMGISEELQRLRPDDQTSCSLARICSRWNCSQIR